MILRIGDHAAAVILGVERRLVKIAVYCHFRASKSVRIGPEMPARRQILPAPGHGIKAKALKNRDYFERPLGTILA